MIRRSGFQKSLLLYTILISSFLQCSYAYAAEQTTTKAATTSIETILGKAAEGLAIAGPYVSLTAQACSIVMEIKTHTFPNEEEKAHAFAVAEKYSLLTAEKEFESCLLKNRSSLERGSSGRPAACQEIARMLIKLGGNAEVNRLTTVYNQFRSNNHI